MTKARKGAAVSTAAPEQTQTQTIFARLAGLGWTVNHRATHEAIDGIVTRDEAVTLCHQTTGVALRGTGATFDEAFLDLVQQVVTASTSIMDVAAVLQDALNAAIAASEAR